MQKQNRIFGLISVMFAFFAMGIIDIIGIVSNYIKSDFGVNNTVVGALSFVLFLSFLLLSIPTSGLMNKIGQRKTVILSIIVMCLAHASLLLCYNMISITLFYVLLGVGITMVQTGFSPLIASVVPHKYLSTTMTFGQFVKAIGSALMPLATAWAVFYYSDWRGVLLVVIGFSIFVIALLCVTPIQEEVPRRAMKFKETFALIKNPFLQFSFIAMLCHVGVDVGMAISSPRLLMERVNCSIEVANYTNTVFFIARTMGCLLGTVMLSFVSNKRFYNIGIVITLIGIVGILFAPTTLLIYICIALVAAGNSNVFPIMVSKCMMAYPDNKNEVSAIMVMGLFGGGLIPLIMGIASDLVSSQIGGISILILSTFIMLYWGIRLREVR